MAKQHVVIRVQPPAFRHWKRQAQGQRKATPEITDSEVLRLSLTRLTERSSIPVWERGIKPDLRAFSICVEPELLGKVDQMARQLGISRSVFFESACLTA